jgi:hypothetical protein
MRSADREQGTCSTTRTCGHRQWGDRDVLFLAAAKMTRLGWMRSVDVPKVRGRMVYSVVSNLLRSVCAQWFPNNIMPWIAKRARLPRNGSKKMNAGHWRVVMRAQAGLACWVCVTHTYL